MTPELPATAAEALARAIKIGLAEDDARSAVDEALAAVGWPEDAPDIMPRVEDLTPPQRALMTALAAHPVVELARHRIANVRLAQWVGTAAPGVLERIITFRDQHQPLWYAVRTLEEDGDEDELKALLATLTIEDRLTAFGEVNAFDYERPYRLERETFFDYRDTDLLDSLGDEGKTWAPAFADHLVRTQEHRPDEEVRWPVFLALVRAKISIDPRWDKLLPLGFGAYRQLTDELVAAIPAERRDAAIVQAIGMHSVGAIGLPLVEKYPSTALVDKLLADDPPAERIKELKRIGKKHAVVAAAVEAALANAPVPVALTVARFLAPKSAAELSEIERTQLAKAGEMWDGEKVTAEGRLTDNDEETSFVGLVEIRTFLDANGKPAFDAWSYAGDSGTIFVAGTEQVAAEVIQGSLECSDPALKAGLHLVLAAKPKKTAKAKPNKPSKSKAKKAKKAAPMKKPAKAGPTKKAGKKTAKATPRNAAKAKPKKTAKATPSNAKKAAKKSSTKQQRV